MRKDTTHNDVANALTRLSHDVQSYDRVGHWA
jgi:hypothetical protein